MLGKSRKGIYNILFSLIYKALSIVVSFVIPRLFILNYGSEINGLQGSVAQIFTYIGLLEAGIGDASVQALYRPLGDKNYDKANGILSATSGYYNKISIVYFFLLAVASLFYTKTVPVDTLREPTVFLYIILYGSVTGINFLYWSKINVLLRASGELYILSLLNIVSYIVNSTIKVIVIVKCWNIVWIQVVYLATSLLCTYTCYLYIRKHYAWLSFKLTPDKEAIQKKNYALAHNINYVVFSSIDITILTFFCDLKIVSIYTTYRMIVSALAGVTTPFIDGIAFILGQTYREEDKREYCALIDAVDVFYSTFSFALFSVMYILMKPFMLLYTSGVSDINYVLEYIPLLYVIIELLTVGREAMNRTITISGRFQETWKIAVTETVINVITSLAAVFVGVFILKRQEYGLYGVLVGTIVSMLYRTIAVNQFANQHILDREAGCSFRIILVNLVMFILTTSIIKNYIPAINGYAQFFLIAIPLSVIMEAVFFAVQLGVNQRQTKYMLNAVRMKVRKHHG